MTPSLDGIVTDVIDRGGGSDPAVIANGVTWTFEELHARSLAIGALASRFAPPGGVMAVLGENHPDWIAAYYGVPAVHRVLCFLNHRLSPGELISQVRRSRASVLLASPSEVERMAPSLRDEGVSVGIATFGDDVGSEIPVTSHEKSEDAPAWLLFTSGTTGSPKGALLSQRNVLASLNASSEARPIAADDVLAFPFPLCHVAGYNVPRFHQHGRPVVLLERFSGKAMVDVIDEHRVTSISVAATMLSDILSHLEQHPEDQARVRTLRTIAYGASPMPVEILRRCAALLDVDLTQGYGMTELAGNAVFLDAQAHRKGLERDASLLKAAGIPGPGVEIRLTDDVDNDVSPGAVGEIVVQAEQVMVGYLDDENATTAALAGGWLHTGDLGRFRDDGVLEVVDRLKDVIVTGGENVSSLEVEAALRAHCPEIEAVAVVGVPDPRWGENVCAVVTLRAASSIDAEMMANRLVDTLAGFKIPRHLVIVDDLPMTHSGKIAKESLRKALADGSLEAGPRRGSRSE